MDHEEEEALLRVCRSHSLFRYYGPKPQHEVRQFEEEFAEFCGAKYALAVTSGTAALHTALSALRVGPGQEVIIPAFLWVSVASAVVNLGAIPVIAEIDDTLCLDASDVLRKITPRTSGIICVHMCGAPADVVPIAKLARANNLFLIEDCAQCVGGSIHGQRVGTFGDIGVFSFQLNKNMSAGEGGAVVTNNLALHRRSIAVHDAGLARDEADELLPNDLESYSWNRGYRLDELRAAVLRVQLRKLPATIARLRDSKYRIVAAIIGKYAHVGRRVTDRSGDTGPFLVTIFPTEAHARRVNERLRWHGIYCSTEASSNTLLVDYGMHIYCNIRGLVEKIGTDRIGTPWTLEANRNSIYNYRLGACPRSDDLFRRSVMLAIPSSLTRADEQDVIDAYLDAMEDADSSSSAS